MATPEEIQALLKTFEDTGASAALQGRLQKLPAALAAIGLAYLDSLGSRPAALAAIGLASLDILTSRSSDERAQKTTESKFAIDGLGDKDRQRLFAALFPGIADHVEASWRLQMSLPYQVGYLRKAFRAPLHPEYTRRARVAWLEALLRVVVRYKYDLDFLVVWAAHLGWGAEPAIGLLLAGALNSNNETGQRLFDKLVSIVNGEHETARIGRYAVTALLSCSRPEAWAVVERLLLAAQRQEGLRQVVLESVDLAHPEAFMRMLRLIEREKLSRFAAVARAVAVWFGLPMDSEQTKLIDAMIAETLEDVQDQNARDARIASGRGQTLYLALWAMAFGEVTAATKTAARIAEDADFERRYPAVHLLAQLGTTSAAQVLRKCLADEDLRVAVKASEVIPSHQHSKQEIPNAAETFSALRELIPRLPEDKVLPPAVWDWNRIRAKKADATAKLIVHRGSRPFSELTPYVPMMDANGRRSLLNALKKVVEQRNSLQADERDLALSLLSDPSNAVRQEAFQILRHAVVSPQEAESIEPLLARKAPDLRRGVMRLLLKQSTDDCRASVQRLSNSANELMKQAAEEIRSELEPKDTPPASIEAGLGLFDPAQRTKPVAPREAIGPKLMSAERDRIFQSLDALVDRQRETPITHKVPNGSEVSDLFGNFRWLDPAKDYPLSSVWREWWSTLEPELKERDEVELARAVCAAILTPMRHDPDWVKKSSQEMVAGVELKFPSFVRDILWHLLIGHSTAEDVDYLLDVVESYLSRLSANYDPRSGRRHYQLSSRTTALGLLSRLIESCRVARPEVWGQHQWRRYWNLLRWIDEGMPAQEGERGKERHFPALGVTLEAHHLGIASDADVYDQLLCVRGRYINGLFDLARVTKRKRDKLFEQYPELADFVGKCRDRILEIELKRGDLPTAASVCALSLRSVFGAELAVRLLKLLGKDPFSRGYAADNQSKSVVLSHLLRVCLPAEGDTPESFTDWTKKIGVGKQRLVEQAVYAPQWARYVEQATGIAGLEDAAYWLHAHTKDSQWRVEEQIRELWFAEVSERTPLPRQELLDGAVDIDWYRSIRGRLSDTDWGLIFDAAKFASGGGGHKRAQLFAGAISGETKAAELAGLVKEKRSQDAVRAIGLVPLPTRETTRRKEMLQRYELLQTFLRGSKKFGAQRQTSEKLAYSIGLTNLARTAGYPDPQRLSWAMEAEAIADLKKGPVEATDGGVKGTLSINPVGEPELSFEKNGKPLKDLPASLRKSEALSSLRTRKAQLAQQTSRMRQSLEDAMIRGDQFTIPELHELAEHPLLRPMVRSLVFVYEREAIWYEDLRDQSGPLRIAHPIDLLDSGVWQSLQRECLQAERVQPFKQVFRELYILTATERNQKTHSGRYEGQQVNPKQAVAVIGKRGWVNVPEEGIRKTFHHDNISVWVTFLEGWLTPAEVDGLTVQHVLFTSKSDGKVIPLEQIHPRVFSEAMRDLDLMVSVAHRGGVDPEATASTIEMRTALLTETLRLLKIGNVRLKEQYAFVDGKIGNYNVHLGSGTVHRQPGGSLCIIPVHSQHRGRIFLPFADNDPKTAEIMSKILLLAQDDKIKDPTILEQLR